MGSRDHVPNETGQEARPTTSWHKLRKRVHLLCFLAFLALPFLNVVRFDIPKERFYFAGYELWINEFAIIFFAMMFLMFLVVAASVFYGRLYCGYVCPQTIFSEASVALETWLRKRVTKKFPTWKPPVRERVGRGLFYALLAAASVLLAFIFICYFVEPRDLWLDPAAQSCRIRQHRGGVNDGCKAGAQEHRLQLLGKLLCRLHCRIFPLGFRKVDVAIPESRHHRAAAASDHFGVGRNLDAFSNGNNPAVLDKDGCVRKRRGSRGRVDQSIYDRQGFGRRRARDYGAG